MREINFDFCKVITYSEYLNIIDRLRIWYLHEYENINRLYKELLVNRDYSKTFIIIKKHNDVITTLLNKIIDELNLKDKDLGIYLSNSFARQTNLLDSDLDINFIYNDSKMQIYEELFESILYQVLGKYRDFVHDSISHRLVDNKDDSELQYILNFDDRTIIESITSGNERIMYNLFNTKKDINSFFKYYTHAINSTNTNEWIYFQKGLTDKYTKLLFDYIIESSKYVSKYRNIHKANNTKKDILRELETLSSLKVTDISLLKKHYKNYAFKYIYECLVLLNQNKDNFDIMSLKDRLDYENDLELTHQIEEYFGLIMIFNLLCDEYGIEFRTRYSNSINSSFIEYLNNSFGENIIKLIHSKLISIYNALLIKLNSIKKQELDYDIELEHVNIKNYSPLSHINNSSLCYQDGVYLLPFINIDNKLVPIHPDTLDDLGISRESVVKYEPVSPTSSTRTVFSLNEKKYYKLALTRQITRSIRDLKNKELRRSEIAKEEISKINNDDLNILNEQCIYGIEEVYNYIIREYPNKKLYPWFYLIVTNTFTKEKMLKVIYKMIDIWMYYASNGIYFESAHTQNFLVDDDLNIYYRDLSDIRILNYDIMIPSYINELNSIGELHSVFFDRSMLSQNIEHFINNYDGVNKEDVEDIKNHIQKAIEKYNISFPDYSMDYDKDREGHHPIKCKINYLREKQ